MCNDHQRIVPDFAFEVFEGLCFRALESDWQKAIDGLIDKRWPIEGSFPCYVVRETEMARQVTIYYEDRYSCSCLDYVEHFTETRRSLACRHILAVALTRFWPLSLRHARQIGIKTYREELVRLLGDPLRETGPSDPSVGNAVSARRKWWPFHLPRPKWLRKILR